LTGAGSQVFPGSPGILRIRDTLKPGRRPPRFESGGRPGGDYDRLVGTEQNLPLPAKSGRSVKIRSSRERIL